MTMWQYNMLWNMLSWILDWTTGQKMFEWCVYTVYLKLIGLHISVFLLFVSPVPTTQQRRRRFIV